MNISPKLLFHVCSCKTPNDVWTTMKGLFGKQDERKGHMLEEELLSLDPRSFNNIQDFCTRYKDLLLQLKGCGVDKFKEETRMALSTLSKVGMKYFVFVSTFDSVTLTSGKNWTMPTLDAFIVSLTREQDKLISIGKIRGTKAHALSMHDGNHNPNHKYKYKEKGKAHAKPKKEGYTKPFNDSFGSEGEEGKKGEKCFYCHRGFHLESSCMKKQIDQMAQMAQIFQKYNSGDHIP